MARKTYKKIEEQMKLLQFYRINKLKLNPNYVEDYNKLHKLLLRAFNWAAMHQKQFNIMYEQSKKSDPLHEVYSERHKRLKCFPLGKNYLRLEKDICEKYNIRYPFAVDEKEDPFFTQPYRPVVEYPINTDMAAFEKAKLKYGYSSPKKLLKYYLEKNRYLSLKIDTDWKLETIMYHLRLAISHVKCLKQKAGSIAALEKAPQLHKIDRYLKVFELRSQKPPMRYKHIAAKLLKYYKGKNRSTEAVINNCKKDYETAFEWIYDIPYKEYDRTKLKKFNFFPCDNCSSRKICENRSKTYAEPCAQLEYYLQSLDGARKEGLFEKGATDVIHPNDAKKAKQRKKAISADDENDWKEKSYREHMSR